MWCRYTGYGRTLPGCTWLGCRISGCFPQETVAIFKLIKKGEIDEATKIYRWFMPLLELDLHPKLVQYIKLAAAQTGIGSEYVRAPRLMLGGEERERILKVIQDRITKRPKINY